MIEEQTNSIKKSLPDGVALVAVSKFQPISAIQRAYSVGQRIFGESRPQELAEKHKQLPLDIQWHFIGHLQTNKIRMIVPFVTLIHSIDSFKLAQAVSDEAVKIGRVVDVLLQIHIAAEQTKQGFNELELDDLEQFRLLKGIRIVGLMGMASNTDDKGVIELEFRTLKQLYEKYNFSVLSMGMSSDYQIAVQNGSNMIRVGSLIFGDRN